MALINDYSAFLTSFNSNKFQKLRDAQKHILDQYPAFEARPDVGIELPTGAGKTLIALLIVEAWRQTGKKCAILSANKTLARQMAKEADELHIPAALMEGTRADIPAREIRAYESRPYNTVTSAAL
jgi:superfamily II DNA or RNA helicase